MKKYLLFVTKKDKNISRFDFSQALPEAFCGCAMKFVNKFLIEI